MNKEQAKDLIRDTFTQPFDTERFKYFVSNLLNHVDESGFTYQGNIIPDAFKPYISTLQRIGKYTDGSNNIDVLVVKLKRETSLERARSMQRNFIAWYLNGSRGGQMKDAALVAFVSPSEEDWRFSLIKMDYKFDENGKVKEEFTPARRWSFLVGENEASHTAQSRLLPILMDDENDPSLEELEEAFNIETVTREFFNQYRDLFIRIKEELDKVLEADVKVRAEFQDKGVDTVNFTKKLMGQIVFLYFLQKKGWFGVGRDDDWGTGSKQFLRELFKGTHGKYKNFFNDILEPLFYEALRIDRRHDDDYYSRFNCKIPFLNGGLFDPINNYDWVHTDILIPNELFSNHFRTKEGDPGNGILDIFDRYNFTVKEDEPLEKDVAIDPELLGKAYERFNAIRPDNFKEYKEAIKTGKKGAENKFNKKFGVYYTPREIVHYMCRQSLINYLHTELTGGYSRESGNQESFKNDIEKLVQLGDLVGENEEAVLEKGKESDTYKSKLPESIRNNTERIDQALANITVCDPAVGSGAFPVGMMHEIVKARNVLTPSINNGDRSIYDFKRECIEKSLYGVDIDPGAVEIAKLRLWLSLVVDEDDINQIKPLPNLDYKIVCGNSLLGVERDLLNDHLFKELEELKPIYFNETNPTKKQEYKKQIDSLISDITNGNTEFDFEVYFSEVFHEKGGFDVSIANPPYIAGKSGTLSKFEKQYFNKTYEVAEYQLDTYILFTEKGLKICRNYGLLTYIMPNTWLSNLKLVNIRKFLLDNASLLNIVVNSHNTFQSANVDTIILIAMRGKRKENEIKIGTLSNSEFQKSNIIEQNIFYNNEKYIFDIHLNTCARNIISKMENNSLKLKELCFVNRGVHAYRKDGFGKSKFSNGPQTEKDYVEKSYHSNTKKDNTYYSEVRGKDVFPYYIKLSNKYISWGNWLAEPRDWKFFTGERIYLRKIVGKTLYVAYVDTENVADQSIYIAKVKTNKLNTKFLLSVLNSKLISWYFRTKANEFDKLFPQIKVSELKEIPIKIGNNQEEFISLVNKILELTKDYKKYLEDIVKQKKVNDCKLQIDKLVYELYGLTAEEIKIVEESTK